MLLVCSVRAVALRECVQEGVLLLTPQVAHACEQYATEARQAAAAEVRRAALALATTLAPPQGACAPAYSPGGSTPAPEWAWLDALHGCVNRAALLAAVRERTAASSGLGLDLKQVTNALPIQLTKGILLICTLFYWDTHSQKSTVPIISLLLYSSCSTCTVRTNCMVQL